jgi:hypothetical protein
MSKPMCETCRYYWSAPGRESECRLKPPMIIVTQEATRWGEWPIVTRDEWCGEHQPVAGAAPVENTGVVTADTPPGTEVWVRGTLDSNHAGASGLVCVDWGNDWSWFKAENVRLALPAARKPGEGA